MDQPNEIGDWIQISILGSGAFGTVMLWRNQKTSDYIAIKKCKFQKPSSLSDKQKDRWRMEVDFLQSINHKNIIGFKQLDPVLAEMLNKYNPSKLPLLSMEYCTKGNLRRYLTNEPIKICGLPENDVRYILEDISCGLNYLHSKKITHRDIKPDNIVLQHCDNRKGDTLYKIIDLGYAKELHDSTLSFVGTLHYLAPEIFYNNIYDHRVDYWSMGIMVFEIISGILPFLPELTPFDRYEKIKDKGVDDICIYLSNSGSITNSSEIKRENFVTSVFKQYIECWLRRVLQMDPENRKFSKNLSPFDYLRFILDQKVIKVFSVYKQEYYSYEINDSTLFGTLKDWISRDIKIPKTDLLYLFRSQEESTTENTKEKIWHCNENNTLLEYLLNNYNKEVVLYVYKKDSIFCEKSCNSKLPNLVKELFNPNANFHLKQSRNMYKQALFFVFNENRNLIELKRAYLCLIQFIEIICDKIKNKYVKATGELSEIFAKIEQFSLKRTNVKINDNLEFRQDWNDCLKYLERLFSNLERREINLKDFKKQYKILVKIQEGINEGLKTIKKMFDKCDMQPLFDKINGNRFLEKPKNGEPADAVLKRIKDVISDAVKMKFNLLVKEQNFKDYSKDFCNILKWSEQLLVWVDDFIINVQKLSRDFDDVQNEHDRIINEAVKSNKLNCIITLNLDDTNKIIKENELLRCQFANLLAEKVADHKTFVEESDTYFNYLS